MAGEPALSLLELMVHVEASRLVTMDLVICPCHFADELMESVEDLLLENELPRDWRIFPWPASTQEIGQRWFTEARSVVLSVPSAVLPRSRNYLINPIHPDFRRVQREAPETLDVDLRLGR